MTQPTFKTMRRALLAAALLVAALPAEAGAQGAVAFTSARCDQGGAGHSGSGMTGVCTPAIFVVGDDGSDLRRLTTGGFPGEQHRSGDSGPAWSHDGHRIAFTRQTNENFGLFRLFVMNANGSGVRRMLPDSPFDDERDASWSPKADLVAFKGRAPNSPVAPLFASASDGSGLRKISPDGWDAQSPAFTPDGSGIAFVASRPVPGKFALTPFEVWLTDTHGRNPLRLTAGDIPIATNAISFSPGAKYLTVTLWDGSLYTVRTDGGELTRLTHSYGLEPDWSATGDALFYRASSGNSMTSVIKRLGFPRVGPPMSLTAPGVADASPDWSLPGRVTSAQPVEDEAPPVVLLEEQLAEPPADVSDEAPSERRRPAIGAAQIPGPKRSKIPFLVMDRSGIRKIDAAAGLRVKGGCRFLETSRRLGRRRACSRPTYVRVNDGDGWKRLTAKLPKGKYDVRFRTLDVEGNVDRRPKPRVVRVK